MTATAPTAASAPVAGPVATLARLLALPARAVEALGAGPRDLSGLALRVALAVPFFFSGLTKWDGFGRLSAGAIYLFTEEFRLHLFGTEIAYPAPKVMAVLSGSAEIALPILLVLGLATRFTALALIAMTAIIQLTVPDGWANFHLPWAAMALAILVHGPGRLSLDHRLARAGGVTTP